MPERTSMKRMNVLLFSVTVSALVRGSPLDLVNEGPDLLQIPIGFVNSKYEGSYGEKSVDWRDKGIVPPVTDQGQLFSSAIFSAVDCIESQAALKSGKLVPLSIQNIIDCSGSNSSAGSFLNQVDVYQFIKNQGGIDTKESYPFKNGSCEFNKGKIGAMVTGYVELPSGSEEALQKAVESVGPVTVLIDASMTSFQMYIGGVYDDPGCTQENLDHAMLVVGFGEEGGVKYWTLKNSWGPYWGEDGYIRVARGKGNRCGVATTATYPEVRLP